MGWIFLWYQQSPSAEISAVVTDSTFSGEVAEQGLSASLQLVEVTDDGN